MTGKVKAMLMDIQDSLGDEFESWEANNVTPEEIETKHGKAVLDAYLDWLYMEIK